MVFSIKLGEKTLSLVESMIDCAVMRKLDAYLEIRYYENEDTHIRGDGSHGLGGKC
ncbi:hypothetical protein [Rubritalea tangerina]|uniref:hypothetical protein n=1 Tax=Rubritalea tangerina TaxID=430798 RepID=UPI0036225A22